MRIYDLDYCRSVAPDLLVNGTGTILLAAQTTSSSEVIGFINSDGSFDVDLNNETTLFLKAEGLNSNFINSTSLNTTVGTTVERRSNGGISISNDAFSSVQIGNPFAFGPFPV